MSGKTIASKRQVFAVVRIDDYVTEIENAFSIVKVMESEAFAERERDRLQALVDGRGIESRYVVVATRMVAPATPE